MHIEKDKFITVFSKMSDAAARPALPLWSELPDLELYMDQVISFITRYFDESTAEKLITPSMVNNYVKLGTIPAPVKSGTGRSILRISLWYAP